MLFNSLEFLLFFPVVTAAFFLLPDRFRWALLLAASCFFYMFFIPAYVLILIFTIVIDYFAGILIERSEGRRRKGFLLASLVANIGVLAVFKYFNFLNGIAVDAVSTFGVQWPVGFLHLILPIGLSFHTYQAMSYTIEVYRGKFRAEHHFGIYALYVMFYPQLVAGPIERPQNLLHQFREPHRFDPDRARDGFRLMLWGMVKKVVVADRLAVLVDKVYADPLNLPAPVLLLGTVLFAFQIYADFSGYSDIAIGAARVMGFKLMTNFRRPYLARSISEFWRRWHISLSTWFRDYLYLPLGGNRVPYARVQLNLMITFLVSGLWHGANWTFVLWGGLNGAFLVAANLLKPVAQRLWLERPFTRTRAWAAWQMVVTFALVCVTWVFFRARTVDDAWGVLAAMVSRPAEYVDVVAVRAAFERLGIGRLQLAVAMLLVPGLWVADWLEEKFAWIESLSARPGWFRWGLYYAGGVGLLVVGGFTKQQFIYFQF